MSSDIFPADAMRIIFALLSNQEIHSVFQVCKYWNQLVDCDEFWKSLFAKKGLPFVEGIDKDYKQIYITLSPKTISGEMFKECFGEVREIPLLAKEKYKMFVELNDPFIPASAPQQKIRRTFWIILNPSHVYRRYDEELYILLKASEFQEDQPEISKDGKEMKVPFTFRNQILLIEYSGHSVFGYFHPEVLLQCNSASGKTAIWLMREQTVYQNHVYSIQKQDVKEKGFELVPLTVRSAFDGIKIRTTGTCPDNACAPYARTANTLNLPPEIRPVAIGGYPTDGGLEVVASGPDDEYNGVVPGMRVDVQAAVAEQTTLEKGG
jgi:hypothetical protein